MTLRIWHESWSQAKMARPGGGFHLEGDGGATAGYLSKRWAHHGGQRRWR
jgi:hypothetical protein